MLSAGARRRRPVPVAAVAVASGILPGTTLT